MLLACECVCCKISSDDNEVSPFNVVTLFGVVLVIFLCISHWMTRSLCVKDKTKVSPKTSSPNFTEVRFQIDITLIHFLIFY